MDQSLISNFGKGDVISSGKCEVILLAAFRDALYMVPKIAVNSLTQTAFLTKAFSTRYLLEKAMCDSCI